MKRLRRWAPRLVLAALVVGCSGPEPSNLPTPVASTTPRPAATADPWAAIESCPDDDRIWGDAYLDAQKKRTLGRLLEITTRLSRECPGRWQAAWAAGLCAYDLERRREAAEMDRKALTLAREARDPIGIALASHELAWIAMDEGRLDEGRSLLEQAMLEARKTGRGDVRGIVLNGLATVLLNAGELERVHELYDEAIRDFERAGFPKLARDARYNRSEVEFELGDLAGSSRSLREIHDRAVEDGDESLRVRAAVTLGNLYFVERDYERADEWYDRLPASAIEQRAFADFNRGRKALQDNDLAEARRRFASASAQDRHRILALLAQAYAGHVDVLAGRRDEGRAALGAVMREADQGGSAEPGWVARWLLGRALLGERRYDEAADLLAQSVEIIDGQGEELDVLTEGLRFLRERSEPYVDLGASLVREGLSEPATPLATRVLDVVERTHARALRSALQGRQGELGRTASLSSLQGRLAADELLLDYLIGEERGVVVAIGPGRFLARPIGGRKDLERPLARYLAALRRPLHSADARREPQRDLERSLDAGIALRRALLDPIAPALHGVRRVLVVPETALALLPLAALPLDVAAGPKPRFVGQELEIGVLPLAGAATRLHASDGPLFLGGDPEPDATGEFPALPLARLELDLIEQVWAESEIRRVERGELTAAALSPERLRDVRSIHLATHAIASTADPGGCAVYLSRGERLGVSQILELKLEASPLVTLSACRTGEGELVPGEGVVGLGWAFLRAGARAVVVSLWSVEDTATTELMVAFHRALRDGLDPVAALARAQREIAGVRFHPAYWAPFVVVLRPEMPT